MEDKALAFKQLEREEELIANDEDEKTRVVSMFEDIQKDFDKLEKKVGEFESNIVLERMINDNIENILAHIDEATFDCRQVIEKMEGRI